MGTTVTVITRLDYLTFLHPLSIQPPLHSSILQPRMAEYDHSMTRTILYLLLLPAATLGRTTESPVCQDNGCETYYGGDAECVNVRHGNWSQIGRQYVLGTVDKERLCQSQHHNEDCCRCLPIRTTTTTTTPITTTTSTTTITTSTTTTSPPVCSDVHGSCRAAFNGTGACIDVRQDDLSDIEIDVDPLDGHCSTGPDKCCECFRIKTEGSSSITSSTPMTMNSRTRTTTLSTSMIPTTSTTTTSASTTVDGGWSSWTYSACSKTCGGGTQRGTRSCNNPVPSNGGKNCVGSGVKTKQCNSQACPGSLMAIGGWNRKSLSSAEVLNTSCDFPLPEFRRGPISVTTADGKTLVCGGYTPSGYTTSCLQFNFQSKTWEHHSNMKNKNRYFSSALALKHGVYILGGDRDARSSSEFLATGSSNWTPGPNIPGPGVYRSCALKLFDTEFVILGGQDMTQARVYSATKNKWTEWPRLSEGVYGQSCLRLGEKIIMTGGIYGTRVPRYTRRTVIIDTKTGSAREVASLNYHRYYAAMELYGNKPVILGGYDGINRTQRSDGEIWNMDTETWEVADISLNIAREGFSLVATDEEIQC